jgi:hypothetical protein
MLQFVFREINIRKLSGESWVGAKEILNVPAFQLVILDRPHARIWRQLHAYVITLMKHNPSIEQYLTAENQQRQKPSGAHTQI